MTFSDDFYAILPFLGLALLMLGVFIAVDMYRCWRKRGQHRADRDRG